MEDKEGERIEMQEIAPKTQARDSLNASDEDSEFDSDESDEDSEANSDVEKGCNLRITKRPSKDSSSEFESGSQTRDSLNAPDEDLEIDSDVEKGYNPRIERTSDDSDSDIQRPLVNFQNVNSSSDESVDSDEILPETDKNVENPNFVERRLDWKPGTVRFGAKWLSKIGLEWTTNVCLTAVDEITDLISGIEKLM